MKQHAHEVLDKINKAKGEEQQTLLKQFADKHPFNMIFILNFNKEFNLDVPEGMPPYKRDEETHDDLFPSNLATEIRKVKNIIKGRNNLPKIKREYIFIQVLEAIPPGEADVLVFAKDHALNELYPNITEKAVAKACPDLAKLWKKKS
jgi:hypothetical protein